MWLTLVWFCRKLKIYHMSILLEVKVITSDLLYTPRSHLIKGSFQCQEDWSLVRSKATKALNASPEPISSPSEGSTELSWNSQDKAHCLWAFRGLGNKAGDAAVFLTSRRGISVEITLQSKSRRQGKTDILRYVLRQANSDLRKYRWESSASIGKDILYLQTPDTFGMPRQARTK